MDCALFLGELCRKGFAAQGPIIVEEKAVVSLWMQARFRV